MTSIIHLRCDGCRTEVPDDDDDHPKGWAYVRVRNSEIFETFDYCPQCWAEVHAHLPWSKRP